MKYWKQPVCTDIFGKEGLDAFDRSVWFEIIMRCRNTDSFVIFRHGNKRIRTFVKRGQMIFRISQFAKEMESYREKVKKSIKCLSESYNEISIEAKPWGLLLTVISYDDLVNFSSESNNESNNEATAKLQRSYSEVASSNKSVENVENANNEKNIAAVESFDKTPINVANNISNILEIKEEGAKQLILAAAEKYRQTDLEEVALKMALKCRGRPDDQKYFMFIQWAGREMKDHEKATLKPSNQIPTNQIEKWDIDITKLEL